jgi:hypothetical protein
MERERQTGQREQVLAGSLHEVAVQQVPDHAGATAGWGVEAEQGVPRAQPGRVGPGWPPLAPSAVCGPQGGAPGRQLAVAAADIADGTTAPEWQRPVWTRTSTPSSQRSTRWPGGWPRWSDPPAAAGRPGSRAAYFDGDDHGGRRRCRGRHALVPDEETWRCCAQTRGRAGSPRTSPRPPVPRSTSSICIPTAWPTWSGRRGGGTPAGHRHGRHAGHHRRGRSFRAACRCGTHGSGAGQPARQRTAPSTIGPHHHQRRLD